MKKILMTICLLATITAHAAPAPFGLELGKATASDLKSKFGARHLGMNAFSHGDMYELDISGIDMDGLKSSTAIFNKDGKLIAVTTVFAKHRFEDLMAGLSSKYKLISKDVPFVGNKSARFKDGDTLIILNAPHLSFEMDMTYIQEYFYDAAKKAKEDDVNSKKKKEASQL